MDPERVHLLDQARDQRSESPMDWLSVLQLVQVMVPVLDLVRESLSVHL